MDQLRRKGRQADSDILGAVGLGRAVLHPFATMSDDRLTGTDVESAAAVGDAQQAPQHDSELVELRLLTRLDPAAGAAHVCDADLLVTRVYSSHILVDQFRLVARGLDARRRGD